MYYSGIDLHSDNCYITTVDESDVVIKEQRVENIPELVVDYFHSLPGPHSAVVESTTGWYWLNDLLEAHGIELVLTHAKYLKAIAYAKVKTDKVDSQTLAMLLRQNLIPRAHKISRELRGLRDTMRIRLRLVQQRTACLRRIESIAGKFNTSSDLPDPYAFQLSALHHLRDTFTAKILELEKSLHPVLVPNDDVQRLLYVPGIGILSALTIYLEIDGIERFVSDKHFVSYCRLVPGADNSNHRQHHRSSKDGNYILKNKEPYRGFKGQPISRRKSQSAAGGPRLPNGALRHGATLPLICGTNPKSLPRNAFIRGGLDAIARQTSTISVQLMMRVYHDRRTGTRCIGCYDVKKHSACSHALRGGVKRHFTLLRCGRTFFSC